MMLPTIPIHTRHALTPSTPLISFSRSMMDEILQVSRVPIFDIVKTQGLIRIFTYQIKTIYQQAQVWVELKTHVQR